MAAASVAGGPALPACLEASEPPEARGLRRDAVRLLVSDVTACSLDHARFEDLPRWLSQGDLLVVNTSGTVSAALSATGDLGEEFELHLSTRLPGGFWTVEVRTPGPVASLPRRDMRAGTRLTLPDGGRATLLSPYPFRDSLRTESRLWLAAVQTSGQVHDYLARYGFPIRYQYVKEPWPIAMYQTVFATEPGSAEMPSAGRPFTSELVTRLIARGVEIAPVLLHTGVSSLEDHEPPYEEFFRVSSHTAQRVTATRAAGNHVVAVGTTVVRALETVTDARGTTSPGEGLTSLVVSAARPLRSVTGLITGLHEPKASHLAILESLMPTEDLARAYEEARGAAYLWHEFGDSHLVLGRRTRARS